MTSSGTIGPLLINLPLIISGTVTSLDESTGLGSCLVVAKNLTTGTGTSTTTASDGTYSVNVAIINPNVGDIISMKAFKGQKIRVTNITITTAMITAGKTTKDIQIYDLRQHVYDVIYTLFYANKPPTYTNRFGTSKTWNVLSAVPTDATDFPAITINPTMSNLKMVTFDNGQTATVTDTEVWYTAKSEDNKVRIDNGRGFNTNLMLDNETTLNYAELYFLKDNPIEDSTIGQLYISGQKYNQANQIYRFKYGN